ncbi:MAG: hypothetical protein HS116_12485 [Planctomycetes bacterium]|nr:hypothetical protein [Planctomycetota bacterium]
MQTMPLCPVQNILNRLLQATRGLTEGLSRANADLILMHAQNQAQLIGELAHSEDALAQMSDRSTVRNLVLEILEQNKRNQLLSRGGLRALHGTLGKLLPKSEYDAEGRRQTLPMHAHVSTSA